MIFDPWKITRRMFLSEGEVEALLADFFEDDVVEDFEVGGEARGAGVFGFVGGVQGGSEEEEGEEGFHGDGGRWAAAGRARPANGTSRAGAAN